ncbi:MAG: acyl carrier protein [Oscillospiraceae bacterium]|jgi:acyl carrier protein|nr:acyl carrier protein [Oscillospiraceae bacterium]
MVFEKIRAIICDQLELEEDEITLESDLFELGADSLDLYDLVMTFEDEFELEVPDEDLERFKTVGDIVDFIEKA